MDSHGYILYSRWFIQGTVTATWIRNYLFSWERTPGFFADPH